MSIEAYRVRIKDLSKSSCIRLKRIQFSNLIFFSILMYIQLVLDGLVAFLGSALGDSLNEIGHHAWKKLVNNIITGIDQELEVLKNEMENDGE